MIHQDVIFKIEEKFKKWVIHSGAAHRQYSPEQNVK
jgi:hypothetical protein